MKILVTGSAGLVGSACVSFFAAKGWEVVGIDNNGRSKMLGTPSKEDFVFCDIRNMIEVEYVFEQCGPFDAIIHAAGQPSHDWSAEHVIEDFEVNAFGTLNLLEATRDYCPDATFLFVSTDKVYGENMGEKVMHLFEIDTRYMPSNTLYYDGFTEDLGLDFAGKRSPFGCSKAAADMYVQEYGNYFGMKTACFRPGCITGRNHEGAEWHGFLAYLAKCIKYGTTYKIFGNGKNVRDQIHASDLAASFFEFIQAPRVAAVYNIGGGPSRSVSVLEAAEKLSKAIGKPFLHEFHEARKGDRLWDVHDITKFRTDYPGFEYKYSLEDIIADLI